MKEAKEETCLDCLHCKVSAKSTEQQRLCFCEMAENVKTHKEVYWLGKKVCNAFDSMGYHIPTPPPKTARKPLLKGVDFLSGLSWRGNYA